MRIEDILNQSAFTRDLSKNRNQQAEAAASFSLTYKNGRDTVEISAEGQAASKQGGGYFTSSGESSANPARAEFKAYMDKVTGRVPSAPKTPEEKLKDLAEKLKKLQSQLSEAVNDPSLSESTRSNRVTSLSAQINQVYAQISEVAKEMSSESSAEG